MPTIGKDGRVYEERTVEAYLPVEEFIEAVREAAKGLDNPTVDVETDYAYGDCSAHISVSGWRPATEAEKAEAERTARAQAIRQEEMRAAQERIEQRLGGQA